MAAGSDRRRGGGRSALGGAGRRAGLCLAAVALLFGTGCSSADRSEAGPPIERRAEVEAGERPGERQVEAGGAGRAREAAPREPPAPERRPLPAAELGRIVEEREGTYGVLVEHVPSGERFEHDARRGFAAASVYKLALAYEVLRRVDKRQVALDEELVVEPDDAVEAEPAGGLAVDDRVSVREALEAAMSTSSNAAAYALLRRVGRADLNRSLAALGLRDTRVPLSATADDAEDEAGADEGAVTTAADMAHLLRLLARDRLLSEPSRAELRRLLAIPEGLDPLVWGVPDETPVLAKTGNLERASNVAGLVETPGGPVIICVFDEDVDPGDARAVSADIARAIYDHFAR